jgi:hypothetical protein
VPAVPPQPRPAAAAGRAHRRPRAQHAGPAPPQLLGLALGLEPEGARDAAPRRQAATVIDWTTSVVAASRPEGPGLAGSFGLPGARARCAVVCVPRRARELDAARGRGAGAPGLCGAAAVDGSLLGGLFPLSGNYSPRSARTRARPSRGAKCVARRPKVARTRAQTAQTPLRPRVAPQGHGPVPVSVKSASRRSRTRRDAPMLGHHVRGQQPDLPPVPARARRPRSPARRLPPRRRPAAPGSQRDRVALALALGMGGTRKGASAGVVRRGIYR